MSDWPVPENEWLTEWPFEPFPYGIPGCYQEKQPLYQPPAQSCAAPPPPSPAFTLLLSPPAAQATRGRGNNNYGANKRYNPRESRNLAEKQRRDKLSRSISQLASLVPPVVAANKKVDKTGILRLTAHYLRAHQYVFGNTAAAAVGKCRHQEGGSASLSLLNLLNGFLLTTTYKGLIVVVSQNVQKYLGYSELELLGQNIFNITHKDDKELMREQFMPKSVQLGTNGELLFPDEPDATEKVAERLSNEKRRFFVRFKKVSQRSEPTQYVTCFLEGSFRKSDRANHGYKRCCQMIRRARARGENPYSSGNDIVFIGVVRPTTETFLNESLMESCKMEYRTRHSIDGEIIQTEQRISLVTGYMTHEVNGVNAMNFMHKDDMRWVVVALREMYSTHRMYGESCYRLMTKNGDFIYMKTRGQLDVEEGSRAVRSFVCTNTMVDEDEGKHLIKIMKKKFMMKINELDVFPPNEVFREQTEDDDGQRIPLEDPRLLEKVILHLVTNLPSPKFKDYSIAIIPPEKEQIVNSIKKISEIITQIKHPRIKMDNQQQGNPPKMSAASVVSSSPDVVPISSVPTTRFCLLGTPAFQQITTGCLVTHQRNMADSSQGASLTVIPVTAIVETRVVPVSTAMPLTYTQAPQEVSSVVTSQQPLSSVTREPTRKRTHSDNEAKEMSWKQAVDNSKKIKFIQKKDPASSTVTSQMLLNASMSQQETPHEGTSKCVAPEQQLLGDFEEAHYLFDLVPLTNQQFGNASAQEKFCNDIVSQQTQAAKLFEEDFFNIFYRDGQENISIPLEESAIWQATTMTTGDLSECLHTSDLPATAGNDHNDPQGVNSNHHDDQRRAGSIDFNVSEAAGCSNYNMYVPKGSTCYDHDLDDAEGTKCKRCNP